MAVEPDTISAIATPKGKGGIGVIRVSGPAALNIACKLTGKQYSPRTITNADFYSETGELIDRGMVLFFKGPVSYTGEDVVELHAHGSPVVLNILLKRVNSLGARMAAPGEFSERAFLNEKIDLVQAEAIADLIESTSMQAARAAVRALQGEFSEKIDQLLDKLITIRVYIEGAMDFVEEEIDFIKNSEVNDKLQDCLQTTEKLLEEANIGKVLNEGFKVVIVGRPNAGKSSLLNRLTRADRAIVSDQPGTTRDVIDDHIIIEGLSINITDTAGIRDPQDEIENEGIKRTLEQIKQGDLLLLVVDGSGQEELAYLKHTTSVTEGVVVHNKIDRKNIKPCLDHSDKNFPQVYLSAKTGLGIELLEQTLEKMIIGQDNNETTILARERHISLLQEVKENILVARMLFQENRGSEIVAEELRKAQQGLAMITGEFTADDLLGEIFSRFCIGK